MIATRINNHNAFSLYFFDETYNESIMKMHYAFSLYNELLTLSMYQVHRKGHEPHFFHLVSILFRL